MKTLTGLLMIAALGSIGCSSASQASGPAPKAWTLSDVKGDVLGMTHADYAKKHPGDCAFLGKDACFAPKATYADIPSSRAADFFHGQLLSLTYGVKHTFNVNKVRDDGEELQKALLEKFGAPATDSGSIKRWDNGTVTIMLSDSLDSKDSFVTFTLNKLQEDQWAEMDKEKAAHQAAAKKDM